MNFEKTNLQKILNIKNNVETKVKKKSSAVYILQKLYKNESVSYSVFDSLIAE